MISEWQRLTSTQAVLYVHISDGKLKHIYTSQIVYLDHIMHERKRPGLSGVVRAECIIAKRTGNDQVTPPVPIQPSTERIDLCRMQLVLLGPLSN